MIDPSGERLSRSSIANIETGKQRVALHLFLDIALALKVDPKELLPAQSVTTPSVVERARNLTPPEQEWLSRVVGTPSNRRRKTNANGA